MLVSAVTLVVLSSLGGMQNTLVVLFDNSSLINLSMQLYIVLFVISLCLVFFIIHVHVLRDIEDVSWLQGNVN